MSAPLLYIVIPAGLGMILAIFNRNVNRNRTISIIGVSLLAMLGLTLPAGSAVGLGSITLKVAESMSVLGRQFSITSGDSSFIVLLFILVALWFVGSYVTEVSRWFFPISLIFIALLVAALSSEIFLFAAPLILVAVILSVPLLSPPETAPGQGVFRYLIFQTLALPCILLAGYILTGFETGPSDSTQALLSAILLGAGFAFLLGIFPFNTWLPQLFEESPIYVTAFILVALPMSVFWLMIHFIDTYVWIRSNEQIFMILRLTGTLMVLVGGIWACFQINLRRILAFAVMVDTGYLLLAIGADSWAGYQVLSAFFLTRALNIGLAALALATIEKNQPSLNLKELKGIFHQYPFATGGYLVALLSMAGMPLLANFPIRLVLTGELGALDPTVAALSIAGGVGLVIACARILAAIYSPTTGKGFSLNENMLAIIFIAAGVVFNLLIALIPGILLTPLGSLLNTFTHLPR
ncbi:MAG: proton-conducting transporter membrane subunit [Anaerolineaceae bacterium]